MLVMLMVVVVVMMIISERVGRTAAARPLWRRRTRSAQRHHHRLYLFAIIILSPRQLVAAAFDLAPVEGTGREYLLEERGTASVSMSTSTAISASSLSEDLHAALAECRW
jgi:hypothetical protein